MIFHNSGIEFLRQHPSKINCKMTSKIAYLNLTHFGLKIRHKIPPRRSQDAHMTPQEGPRRSKTSPRRLQDAPRRILPPFWAPTWGHLGHLFPPKTASRPPGRLQKAFLGMSWDVLGACWGLLAAKSQQERLLEASWPDFRPFLGGFLRVFPHRARRRPAACPRSEAPLLSALTLSLFLTLRLFDSWTFDLFRGSADTHPPRSRGNP